MAFPTEPTDLPEWATGGTVTTPSGGKKATGWIFGEAPPFDYFNWYMLRVYQWIVWLGAYLDVEHSRTAGKHTKVTYAAARLITIPLGSPDKGGWITLAGTPILHDTATPPHVAMGAGAGTLTILKEIPLVIGPDDGTTAQWSLWRIDITYKRPSTAGNSFTYEILSMLADGTGAYVVVSTGTLASATWQATSQTGSGLPVTVDPLKRYFVRITTVQGAGAAADEVALARVDIEAYRSKLE